MKTTNSLGNPISQAFKDSWAADNMKIDAKVICEFGNNRFNGNHVTTASSTKVVNLGVNDAYRNAAANFWTPDEAFNNRNRNSMRWAVCDRSENHGTAGAKTSGCRAWGPSSNYSPYRAVNVEDVQGAYEHGWWSANKSDSSGNFATPEYVQCVFEIVRNINAVWLFTDEAYPNMGQITIQYSPDGTTWLNVPGATAITLDPTTYINKFPMPDPTACKGLKVLIYSTALPNDFARISECQGILIKDISADIINIDISETREQFDGTVPIGVLKTVTCNGQVQNIDQAYSTTNTSSPMYPYIGRDNRIEVYFGIDTTAKGGSGFEYVQMGEFFVDQWDIEGANVTARWGSRDFGKFLQDNLVGFAKVWRNQTVNNVIDDLIQRAGKTSTQIFIDQYALRNFPLLYVHDISFWNFLSEVAFADQAYFGFDGQGNFTYTSYKQLNVAPYTSSIYNLDGTQNLVDASAKTELYLNRVIVDNNGINNVDIGRRIIWTAPDPTICSWNQLASNISSTDLTIPVTLDNTVQAFYNPYTIGPNGEHFPDPLGGKTDIYLRIGNEIIYCDNCDAHNFYVYAGSPLEPVGVNNPTGRGYLGSIATSHSVGDYIGEVKYFDNIQWQVAPALQVFHPFLTAIDGLELLYPTQNVNNSLKQHFRSTRGPVAANTPSQADQASIVYFSYDAFGAKLAVSNCVPAYTALTNHQKSPSYSPDPILHADGTTDHYRNDTVDWDCVIAGIATMERHSTRKHAKAVLTNKRLVRRHGKSEIEINNPWIQTERHAQDIAKALIDEYNTPRSVIQARAIMDPRLDLADRVTVKNYTELTLNNIDYHILNINWSYDGGLQATLALRQVKS